MKEYPILFSALMVRAILEGRKTQTRRMIKPQPNAVGYRRIDIAPDGHFSDLDDKKFHCPYGKTGDCAQFQWRMFWRKAAFYPPEKPSRWIIKIYGNPSMAKAHGIGILLYG